METGHLKNIYESRPLHFIKETDTENEYPENGHGTKKDTAENLFLLGEIEIG